MPRWGRLSRKAGYLAASEDAAIAHYIGIAEERLCLQGRYFSIKGQYIDIAELGNMEFLLQYQLWPDIAGIFVG